MAPVFELDSLFGMPGAPPSGELCYGRQENEVGHKLITFSSVASSKFRVLALQKRDAAKS